MAFQYLPLFAFIVMVNAGPIPVAQVYHPASAQIAVVKSVAHDHPKPALNSHHYDNYDPQNHYKFAYEINDEDTGDNHSHLEARDGDVVHGEYSLIDADGFKRIVQYTVDPHSGFNAVVNRIPLDQHVKAVPKSVTAAVHSYVLPVQSNAFVKEYPVHGGYRQHH